MSVLVLEATSWLSTSCLCRLEPILQNSFAWIWFLRLVKNWYASFEAIGSCKQCEQIGLFMKDFGDNFSFIKVSQKFGNFLGYFEKQHFVEKTCCGYFWATIGEIGIFIIPLSGHTDSYLRPLHKQSQFKEATGSISCKELFQHKIILGWF